MITLAQQLSQASDQFTSNVHVSIAKFDNDFGIKKIRINLY